MKANYLKGLVMLILMLMAGTAMYSQGSQGAHMGIPGLTDDQKTQIGKLRIAHQKEMQGLRNQLAENKAHYRTLMTAEKADINAINKNIDEFTGLKATMMKKQAAHIQDIRKLLNDEQRLAFDNKLGRMGKGWNNGKGHSRELRGYGQGSRMGNPHMKVEQ